MQTKFNGEKSMAHVDDIRSPNWKSYHSPPRVLDAARSTESASGGKLNCGIYAAAPARMKPLANRHNR